MAPWMLLLFPALFISLLLSVPSHCTVDPTSTTLAISQATGTICGIVAGSQHHTIQCTIFPEPANSTAFPIYPTILFDAISGGSNFICSLRSGGGSFYCWDGIGQRIKRIYNGTMVLSQLSIGAKHVAAIDGDRLKIQWWRCGLHGRICIKSHFPKSVSGGYHFLTSGDDFACALNGTSSVHCWGSGAKLIENKFSGMNISKVTAGGGRICGLNELTGHLICTGDPLYVPSGEAFEFTSLAIGSNQTCAISRKNGSVICWGHNGSYFPMGSTKFEFIVAGGDLTCGLTTDAFTVSCWGLNGTYSSHVIRSLPKILPGICVPNDTICSCGVYSDSGDLCGGSLVICKKYGTATTGSCQFSPPVVHAPVKKSKLEKLLNGWLGKLIAAVLIVMFFIGCFFICWCCHRYSSDEAVEFMMTMRDTMITVVLDIVHGICTLVARLLQCVRNRNM